MKYSLLALSLLCAIATTMVSCSDHTQPDKSVPTSPASTLPTFASVSVSGNTFSRNTLAEEGWEAPDKKAPSVQSGELKQLQATLNAQAQAKRKEILADSPNRWAKVSDEWEKDKGAYQFEVKRWGSWLEVSIARIGYKDKIRKFSTSINLDLVTTIHLEAGHPPDREGLVTYHAIEEPLTDHTNWDGLSSDYCRNILTLPMKGMKWSVMAALPEEKYRELFYEAPKSSGLGQTTWGGMTQCGLAPVEVEETRVPRYAQDDEIRVDGIAVIYAPAGLGEEVYHKILQAKDPAPLPGGILTPSAGSTDVHGEPDPQ